MANLWLKNQLRKNRIKHEKPIERKYFEKLKEKKQVMFVVSLNKLKMFAAN